MEGTAIGSRDHRGKSVFIILLLTVCGSGVGSAPSEVSASVAVVVEAAASCAIECPSGTGLVGPCTNATTLADCKACVDGENWSSGGRAEACQPCRSCPANSHVRHQCNASRDTECECQRDFYQHAATHDASDSSAGPETQAAVHLVRHHGHRQTRRHPHGLLRAEAEKLVECRACDLCQHGWGAARPCSHSHNTVCRKCPAGTFSSVLSSSLGCSLCSVCSDDQVTLHECTPIQDTVCADKDMGHPSRRVITKPIDNLVHKVDEYNNEGIISVYCAILGAIVLGLLIYVVMKQWRLRSAANKMALLEPRGSSAVVPLNAERGLLSPLDGKAAAAVVTGSRFECEISPCGSRRMQGSDGSRGSDSAFVAPGSDGHNRDLKAVTLETRLRDIGTAKRREMETMLNDRRDHGDWKALARDLGYTSSRIASFEARAFEKQTGPCRHLFADWAKREDSTVANVLQSLCNIGRHDVTLVLLPIQQSTAATLPRTRHHKSVSAV